MKNNHIHCIYCFCSLINGTEFNTTTTSTTPKPSPTPTEPVLVGLPEKGAAEEEHHSSLTIFFILLVVGKYFYTGADPGFQVGGGALKKNHAEQREARKFLVYFM